MQSKQGVQLAPGSKVPNLHLSAISSAQLRAFHHNFVGLPPASDVRISSDPSTFQYVRQESALWDELHTGILTTGKLAAALGLMEPAVAKAIGGRASEHALAAAHAHMMQQPWQPPDDDQAGSVEDCTAYNEVLRLRQFSTKLSFQDLPSEGMWGPNGAQGRRQLSERVSAQGELACRLQWGSIQEGAGIHALGQVFPHALIEEVGLQRVRPSQTAAMGIPCHELPHLGATPDALITHLLPIRLDRLQHAQGQLEAAATQTQTFELGQLAAEFEMAATAEFETGQLADAGGDVTGTAGTSGHVSTAGTAGRVSGAAGAVAHVAGIACAAHEMATQLIDEALSQLLSPSPSALSDTLESSSASVRPSDRPSASLDGPATTSDGTLAIPPTPLLDLHWSNTTSIEALSRLLQDPTLCLPPAPGPMHVLTSAAVIGPASTPAHTRLSPSTRPAHPALEHGCVRVDHAQGVVWVPWRECVELKSHSPFKILEERTGSKGTKFLQYGVRDYGPMQHPRTMWFPQLQLECLAANTHSALLMSRSAGKGVRVWRVKRDDAYLAVMLQVLRVMHVTYTVPGQLPERDAMQRPNVAVLHKALVASTLALVEAAVEVAYRPGPRSAPSTGASELVLKPAPGADTHALWTVT